MRNGVSHLNFFQLFGNLLIYNLFKHSKTVINSVAFKIGFSKYTL